MLYFSLSIAAEKKRAGLPAFAAEETAAAEAEETPDAPGVMAEIYSFPVEKLKNLKKGGGEEKHMPSGLGKIEYTLEEDPVITPATGMKVLTACCIGGLPRDYYTYEMPWAFHLYEFEEGVPTLTVFQVTDEGKKGRFEIVVMDPRQAESVIKEIEVRVFKELLNRYSDGIEWEGSVRVEKL